MQDSNEAPALIRTGRVTQYDKDTLRARVHFPDMGITSHWLPLLVMNSRKTKDSYYLDEGEHVICLMQGTGSESGFILGAIYDDKNKPVINDSDKRSVKFDDGTAVIYDRKEHKLLIDCAGEIEITAAKHITLSAPRIDLN